MTIEQQAKFQRGIVKAGKSGNIKNQGYYACHSSEKEKRTAEPLEDLDKKLSRITASDKSTLMIHIYFDSLRENGLNIQKSDTTVRVTEGTTISDGKWSHVVEKDSRPFIIKMPDGQDLRVAGSNPMPQQVNSSQIYCALPQSISVESGSDFSLLPRTDFQIKVRVKSRASLILDAPENEYRAIETLREMITETEFRKYIKDSFILVSGRSGDVYQIFRTRAHTKVWRSGRVVEEVCVRIKDKAIPPTDNVIAFKTLIEVDEKEFKKLGNVYSMVA